MNEIYTRVPSTEYRKLIKEVEDLKKENATLKADLKKATAKSDKAEIKIETKEPKKGGNK